MGDPEPLFLKGGGEMGERMRALPWRDTRLGEPAGWPRSLGAVVGLMLNSKFPMFLLWTEQHVCLYNDGYVPLLGARHPAALARPFIEVWPEIWSEIGPLIDGAYAGQSTFFDSMPLRLMRHGFDEEAWFTFSYSPIRDDDGVIRGMFCACHETTAHVRAEAALRQSETRFRTFAQAVPNHVWAADAVGRLDFVNERVCEYAGMPAETLQGEGWASIVHPEDLEAASRQWRASIDGGQPYHVEFRLRRADGCWRWHLVRALPIRSETGRVERWIGTNTDIDDGKSLTAELRRLNATLEERVQARTRELEQAHEALRQSQKPEAIGQLTGGIAHDFNNVLQVIGGNLQMLRDAIPDDRPALRRLDAAIAGVERGAKLALHLLAFARKQALQPVVLNVGRLVRDMDDMLRRALGEPIDLVTVVGPGESTTFVDPAGLESSLLNLAINARDAMRGRGRLSIEIGQSRYRGNGEGHPPELGAGDYVTITVTDDGCGMTEAVRQRAIEPFFTTKPEGHGTGLGLSMVYGFVRQSGGYLQLASRPGEGTTVRIWLPRSTAAETPVEPVPGTVWLQKPFTLEQLRGLLGPAPRRTDHHRRGLDTV